MVITAALAESTPAREDGESWPIVVAHIGVDGSELLTFADTHTEVLGAFVAGYADLPDTPAGHDQALFLRYNHAVAVATAVQGGLCDQASDAGLFNPADESEDVLTALFTERDQPFLGVPLRQGGTNLDWPHEVPLVLIDTHYEPFVDRPVPTGRIVWLRPVVENDYLQSLAETGTVRYLTAV